MHYLRFLLCHALYQEPRVRLYYTDDIVLEDLKSKEIEKAEAKKEKEAKRIERT